MSYYTVRVVDGSSKQPINKAKVKVDLETLDRRFSGTTNSNGRFAFTWFAMASGNAEMHITVEAPGFCPLESYSVLAEDRLISLSKME